VIRLSFLALALVVVPGALLFVLVALILKQRRRSRSERIAEEQAKFLPRNPARDEAKKALEDAQDAVGAREALAEGGSNVSHEEVMRSLSGNFAGAECVRCKLWLDHPGHHMAYDSEARSVLWWSDEDEGRLKTEIGADLLGEEPALKHVVRNGRVEWHKSGAFCDSCGVLRCTDGPQKGTCPRCLCTPGTDEPSAPEEGHGMPAGWKWDADGYYYKMIGADPAIGPDCTYSFWSPPEDKADEFAQRFWSGLGEAFTASSGTAGTTLTVNDEGEVSDAEWDEIMAKLPDGAQVVSVGPRLCAVCPVGRVVRWSKPENAWLLTDYATATAARAALGLAT
jgi:hypothetical protein